ncbi:hypothetical protein SAMN05443428_10369 [Caloramator quimbayensis]|uniref:Uncharacterized protein n=1 Tax=Caloramator quimbayensis TaxID=1147123 RepID=A0A1T4WRH4_9CLOT|nr:hypothetical protein [Caloramator quimbayensis]SKA79465.1 hypothetical protein SAMN05443428_10369 [Caloramator quimbayensis]
MNNIIVTLLLINTILVAVGVFSYIFNNRKYKTNNNEKRNINYDKFTNNINNENQIIGYLEGDAELIGNIDEETLCVILTSICQALNKPLNSIKIKSIRIVGGKI